MRAGRITVSTRAFAICDVPIPIPKANEVRIKVEAAGVCLSDVHFLAGTLSPGYLKSDVVTIGHEVAGIVDAVGESIVNWKLGDRVIICAGERDQNNRIRTLGFDYDGGFAEFTVVPSETLVSIPANLPFEQACIIPDAVSTPWAAITQTAKIQKGESVAVFGIGGLGIHAIHLLRIIGAHPIIAVDPLPQARERALQVGADFTLDPTDQEFFPKMKAATENVGLAAAFDFAGSSAARGQALRLLGEGGRLIIVGLNNEPIVIPNDIAFSYKRSQVLGHYGSERIHTEQLVELVRSGLLDLSGSISSVLPLENAALALEQLLNKTNNPIRIVLKP